MELKPSQLRLYIDTIYFMGIFNHANSLKTNDLVTCAHDFLTGVRRYEEFIPEDARKILKDFTVTKDLAMKIVKEATLEHMD